MRQLLEMEAQEDEGAEGEEEEEKEEEDEVMIWVRDEEETLVESRTISLY